MSERASLYRSVAKELPGVYQRDADSYRQVADFLSIPDALYRQFANGLIELPTWLSPGAVDIFPPGFAGDDFGLDLARRRDEVLEEVAKWFSFDLTPRDLWEFDSSGDLAAAKKLVQAKSELLRRMPSLMREKGTPAGFLAWLAAMFRLDTAQPLHYPILIEHFRYRNDDAPISESESLSMSESSAADRCDEAETSGLVDDGYANRATLLLPHVAPFDSWAGFKTAVSWIQRNGPVQVQIDVCLVSASYWRELVLELLPDADDLKSILRAVREHVVDEEALQPLDAESDRGAAVSQLDLRRLPAEPGADHE